MREDVGTELKGIKVDGGASRNKFLMQFQADIVGTNVIRPIISETTALGAACLAGLAVGFWKDKEEIKKFWHMSDEFEPQLDADKVNKYYHGWQKAVKRSLKWEEE